MSYLVILWHQFLKIWILLLIIFYSFFVLYVTDDSPAELPKLTKQTRYKYVLLWPFKNSFGFRTMEDGDASFVISKCKYQNCFITENRDYFHDLKKFDAIAFNSYKMTYSDLPNDRSPKQKYIFASLESPDFYPQCHKIYDSYFNWTWTYRLDSDFQWSFMRIYDANGSFVGPAYDINWVEDMKPIGEELKAELDKKSKAVAWFVSNCNSKRKREIFVEKFRDELNKFGWEVDIYGKCGNPSCPKETSDVCFQSIRRDYYFYLAFENSFAEDYVTEKLLTALNYSAVPIVYGEADYKRFLPPGSYLNALEYGPRQLARMVNYILSNKTMYYDFFRWRSYYRYVPADQLNYCKLCEMLNNKTKMTEKSVVQNFRRWWNGRRFQENCPDIVL